MILAQEMTVAAEAIADAERDAIADVNKPLWFGAGCLFCIGSVCVGGVMNGVYPYGLPLRASFLPVAVPLTGIVGTYFYRPNPPSSRLIGKSPEYIVSYAEAYKEKTGKLRAQWALTGVGGGIIVVSTLFLGSVCLISTSM